MALSGSLNFLTASEFTVKNPSVGSGIFGYPAEMGESNTIPAANFTYLNLAVHEPITASDNFLGYADLVFAPVNAARGYSNYSNPSFVNVGSTYNTTERPGLQTTLNTVILKRNGPYQHPSWKQIRGGQHPIARGLRLHNTMSIDSFMPDAKRREEVKKAERVLESDRTYKESSDFWSEYNETGVQNILGRSRLRRYYLPAVAIHHKPLEFNVDVKDPKYKTSFPLRARATLMNEMLFFDENASRHFGPEGTSFSQIPSIGFGEKLNIELRISGEENIFVEGKLKQLKHKQYGVVDAARSTDVSARNFLYTETVFPQSVNMFRPFKLEKPVYEEIAGHGSNGYDRVSNRSFWRYDQPGMSSDIVSNGSSRIRTAESALNSQGLTQSMRVYEDRYCVYDTSCAVDLPEGYRELMGDVSVNEQGIPEWNFTQNFIQNGIIVHSGLNTLTASVGAPGTATMVFVGGEGQWSPASADNATLQLSDEAGATKTYTYDTSSASDASSAVIGLSGVTNVSGAAEATRLLINSDNDIKITVGQPSSSGNNFVILLVQEVNGITAANPVSSYSKQTITNFLGGLATAGSDGLPIMHPSGAFISHETYNPYPLGLLSMWPLDPRPDLWDGITTARGTFNTYTAPKWLTSSIGGKGIQIGLTPHRMKKYDSTIVSFSGAWPHGVTYTDPGGSTNTVGVFETSASYFAETPSAGAATSLSATPQLGDFDLKQNAYASYIQLLNLMTGTAGELVYSTKPTMFFHKQDYSSEIVGYFQQTASMQYNRHTFPYNTPFYATNRIRGRDPFFNSYSEYSQDLKYIGREFSIIPEYRVTDNLEFYYDRLFQSRLTDTIWRDPEHTAGYYGSGYDSMIKAVREFKPSNASEDEDPSSTETKLDFLNLDGAWDYTSSADIESFESTSPGTTYHLFDTLELTSSARSLSKETLHWRQNSVSVTFHEKYSHLAEDKFHNFLSSEFGKSLATADKDSIPSRVGFDLHVVKKLLPYKNFYPATKTVEVGEKFKNFVYEALHSDPFTTTGITTANAKEGVLQTVLEPMFAPGILYNSIKSGIAVGYPIHLSNSMKGKHGAPVYFCPLPFFSGTMQGESFAPAPSTNYKNLSNRFSKHITSSFNYGGFYMMGASRCIPSILNTPPSQHLSFEALYRPELFLEGFQIKTGTHLYLTTDFLDLDINAPEAAATGSKVMPGFGSLYHAGAAFTDTGPRAMISDKEFWSDKKKDLYQFSINNFLCETMNFFLEDQEPGMPGVKLPIALSKPKKDSDLQFDTAQDYFMEVSLEMGSDQVVTEGPRNAGVGGGGLVDNLYTSGPTTMRGAVYGPPTECVAMSGNLTIVSPGPVFDDDGNFVNHTEPYIASWRKDIENNYARDGGPADYESYFGANLQDPAYAPYTPPYFYGKSSQILKFTPSGASTSFNELMGKLYQNSFYNDTYEFSTSSQNDNADALCRYLPGTSSAMMSLDSRMKIDQSLITLYDPIMFRDLEDLKGENHYSIAIRPKWVCPVLDFSSSFSAIKSKFKDPLTRAGFKTFYSFLTNSYHDNTTGRGLWGGYGNDPYDAAAMKQVNKAGTTGKDSYSKGLRMKIRYPFSNQSRPRDPISFREDLSNSIATDNAFFTEINSQTQDTSGSLGEKLGFLAPSNRSQPAENEISFDIGKIASSKQVTEAIVVIPYFEKPVDIRIDQDRWHRKKHQAKEFYSTREIIPGRHFLPIQEDLFDNLLSMNLVERDRALKGTLSPVHELVLESSKASLPMEQQNSDLSTSADVHVGFLTLEEAYAAKNTDAYNMIDVLLGNKAYDIPGYELPPEFDFIHYNIKPFQMFVIPVDHTLEKQEMMDIYQNVMPESSIKASKEKITARSANAHPGTSMSENYTWVPQVMIPSTGQNAGTLPFRSSLHQIRPWCFLDPQFIYSYQNYYGILEEGFNTPPGWLRNSYSFYNNLKFMAFKIKQKAHKNYTTYNQRQLDRHAFKALKKLDNDTGTRHAYDNDKAIFDTRIEDVFGNNWPYDDFSLVETVKIDIKYEVPE